jgi:hypothetical protein
MTKTQLNRRFKEAIQYFWDTRDSNQERQQQKVVIDSGARGSVTANIQMSQIAKLISDALTHVGIEDHCIKTKSAIELPGYYRPEKQWDLLVVAEGRLLCALEFKSQVGPSFGNNFNNRVEEAIGSATDVWVAYREGRFGTEHRPFLGYFFLLEDCPAVQKAVRVRQPHFQIDPIFKASSYAQRYQILCRRLVLERLYDATCLTLATRTSATKISHPSEDLNFIRFIAQLRASVVSFLEGKLDM